MSRSDGGRETQSDKDTEDVIPRAQSVSGKTFLLFYALGGVLVFAAVIATVMAPILHRMLHAFHVDVPDEASGRQAGG